MSDAKPLPWWVWLVLIVGVIVTAAIGGYPH